MSLCTKSNKQLHHCQFPDANIAFTYFVLNFLLVSLSTLNYPDRYFANFFIPHLYLADKPRDAGL